MMKVRHSKFDYKNTKSRSETAWAPGLKLIEIKNIIKKESLNLWFCFTVYIQHQITITFNQVMLPRLSNIYPVDSNKRPLTPLSGKSCPPIDGP